MVWGDGGEDGGWVGAKMMVSGVGGWDAGEMVGGG